jgi:predicted ABC-type ATPase
MQRVAARVAAAGHHVPEEAVRRQYRSGIRNFVGVCQPIMTSWAIFNASGPEPAVVAERVESQGLKLYDSTSWGRAPVVIERGKIEWPKPEDLGF